ncbi:MAG: arylsulfatase, partial [Thermoanaerobaculia bacterium]
MAVCLGLVAVLVAVPAAAQNKPNIILIVSDDTGYGDLGPYGGGEGRGMPTPSIDRLAAEGMTFFSFYAQPSCTPGRAAMQTGRIPNRSGMTTVAFQGQGGGLPAAEWTLASVLKTAGYQTFFSGKWHLGESDYALPNAQGYDEMKYAGLYHLNAYTYADPTWFPDMSADLRAMFKKVTKGAMSGNAGETPVEEFKINGQYVDTPDASTADYPDGVVGIPFFDGYVEKASLEYLDKVAKSDTPFFMNVNFMKVHQPNMPHPDYIHRSLSKSKYADSVVELDSRIGRIMDKVRALGLDENTIVFYTTDNGAWQDVYPDAGYTPFRGTKGTEREGGNRVPAIAWMPGKIKAGMNNHDILGGLDLMATFAAIAGVELPEKDRAGEPIIFDSFDMSPVFFGTGKCERDSWFYFTENELAPGAARVGNYKAMFNLRGDNGQQTGGLAVDSNLGWKGPELYVATVPQVFDLWQDPQERYDIFMNNYTERTWTLVTISAAIEEKMKTYVKYPPRPLQSETYTG